MNKCCLLILGLLVTSAPLPAHARTFTSPDGRTLDAEIVAATAEQVTLKLTSGQSIAAAVTRFSPADQKFIADWRKQNPAVIKYDFAANYTKNKKDTKKTTRNNIQFTLDTWVCNMRITNRSGQTPENVKVDYDIYYEQTDGASKVTRKSTGSATIPMIKHLQELVVPTEEVKLETSQLEGGFYYEDGARSRQRDSLSGMVISLSHEGKKVFSWVSGGVPAGRVATADGKDSLFGK